MIETKHPCLPTLNEQGQPWQYVFICHAREWNPCPRNPNRTGQKACGEWAITDQRVASLQNMRNRKVPAANTVAVDPVLNCDKESDCSKNVAVLPLESKNTRM